MKKLEEKFKKINQSNLANPRNKKAFNNLKNNRNLK